MFSAQTEWQTIPAEGGGNCAFNAFILGLKKVIDDDQLETKNPDVTHHDFLIEFNKSMGKEAKWSAFVAYMRTTEQVRLQNELHRLFRQFSISLLRKKHGLHGQRHQETMFESVVKGAFQNYILEQLGTPVLQTTFTKEDICARLSCVKTEFETIFKADFASAEFVRYKELASVARDEAKEVEFNALRVKLDEKIANIQKTTLLDDWNKKLYTELLDAMAQEGAWAGDPELAALAEYFNVMVDVQRVHSESKTTMVHHIHYDHGQFDSQKLKEPKIVIPRLVTLDIVDQAPVSLTSYRWKNDFDEKTLEKVLSKVPEHDVVESIIDQSESEVQHNKGLKGCKLKPSLPAHITSALEVARVVTKEKDGFCFDITKEEYEAKVQGKLPATIQQIVDSELLRVADKIQGKVVDASLFSPECTQQLSQRGVIKDAGKDKVVFVLGEKEVRARITEVPEKAEVLALWQATHRKSPTVTLANESASHWNLKVPKVVAQIVDTQKATVSLPFPKSAPAPTEVKLSEAITLKYKSKPEVEENKWKKIIEEVQSAAGEQKKLTKEITVSLSEKSIKITPVAKGITYTFTDAVKVEVDEQTQKDLDWELAEKLQREEYNKSLKR